jgi:hypothetical protein
MEDRKRFQLQFSVLLSGQGLQEMKDRQRLGVVLSVLCIPAAAAKANGKALMACQQVGG